MSESLYKKARLLREPEWQKIKANKPFNIDRLRPYITAQLELDRFIPSYGGWKIVFPLAERGKIRQKDFAYCVRAVVKHINKMEGGDRILTSSKCFSEDMSYVSVCFQFNYDNQVFSESERYLATAKLQREYQCAIDQEKGLQRARIAPMVRKALTEDKMDAFTGQWTLELDDFKDGVKALQFYDFSCIVEHVVREMNKKCPARYQICCQPNSERTAMMAYFHWDEEIETEDEKEW